MKWLDLFCKGIRCKGRIANPHVTQDVTVHKILELEGDYLTIFFALEPRKLDQGDKNDVPKVPQ